MNFRLYIGVYRNISFGSIELRRDPLKESNVRLLKNSFVSGI